MNSHISPRTLSLGASVVRQLAPASSIHVIEDGVEVADVAACAVLTALTSAVPTLRDASIVVRRPALHGPSIRERVLSAALPHLRGALRQRLDHSFSEALDPGALGDAVRIEVTGALAAEVELVSHDAWHARPLTERTRSLRPVYAWSEDGQRWTASDTLAPILDEPYQVPGIDALSIPGHLDLDGARRLHGAMRFVKPTERYRAASWLAWRLCVEAVRASATAEEFAALGPHLSALRPGTVAQFTGLRPARSHPGVAEGAALRRLVRDESQPDERLAALRAARDEVCAALFEPDRRWRPRATTRSGDPVCLALDTLRETIRAALDRGQA